MQTDFYKDRVNLEAFARAEKNSRHSLCYNGDIVDAASAAHIREGFPSVDKFMIGRGLIKHPWLLEELSGGRQEKQERKERFFRFHNAILEGYRQQMSGDKNTLFKMKELWAYWGENFADADQRLKKSENVSGLLSMNVWWTRCFVKKSCACRKRVGYAAIDLCDITKKKLSNL